MSCPVDAVPTGWKVWRGAVPPQLTDMAVAVRDKIRRYEYGSIPATMPWKAADGTDITVGAWKSHHTWTYKNGVLITGICIPGVTLVSQPTQPDPNVGQFKDDISTPDPNAARYDGEAIDWMTVGLSALAGAAVVGLFIAATKTSPHKSASRALRRMP